MGESPQVGPQARILRNHISMSFSEVLQPLEESMVKQKAIFHKVVLAQAFHTAFSFMKYLCQHYSMGYVYYSFILQPLVPARLHVILPLVITPIGGMLIRENAVHEQFQVTVYNV